MAYTKSDVARQLGVSVLTAHRYITAGMIKSRKAPGRNGIVTVEADELEAYRRRLDDLRALTYDTATAARVLDCHPRTVQRLVRAGALEAVPTPGRAHRITRVSVVKYRAAQREKRAADLARFLEAQP